MQNGCASVWQPGLVRLRSCQQAAECHRMTETVNSSKAAARPMQLRSRSRIASTRPKLCLQTARTPHSRRWACRSSVNAQLYGDSATARFRDHGQRPLAHPVQALDRERADFAIAKAQRNSHNFRAASSLNARNCVAHIMQNTLKSSPCLRPHGVGSLLQRPALSLRYRMKHCTRAAAAIELPNKFSKARRTLCHVGSAGPV